MSIPDFIFIDGERKAVVGVVHLQHGWVGVKVAADDRSSVPVAQHSLRPHWLEDPNSPPCITGGHHYSHRG